MNVEELKHELRRIFGEKIVFNKEFDQLSMVIKNLDKTLIEWCLLVKEGKIRAVIPPKLKGSIVFIKKIGSSNRCFVIKIVNDEFKEVHLGDHAYYDQLRDVLGLKKGSRRY